MMLDKICSVKFSFLLNDDYDMDTSLCSINEVIYELFKRSSLDTKSCRVSDFTTKNKKGETIYVFKLDFNDYVDRFPED